MPTKTIPQPKGNLLRELELLVPVEFTSRDKKTATAIFGESKAAKALAETKKAIELGNSRIVQRMHERLPANELAWWKSALQPARALLQFLEPNDPNSDFRSLMDAAIIEKDEARLASAQATIPTERTEPRAVLQDALRAWIESGERRIEALEKATQRHKTSMRQGHASPSGSDGGARRKNIFAEKKKMLDALDTIYESMASEKSAKGKKAFQKFVSEIVNRKPTEAKLDRLIEII